MNGLETAIRGALERSDRTNAETRARIYQSARQALEAGLRKQNVDDPQVVTEQRHRLEAVIHSIELEERGRLDSAVAAPAATRPQPTPPQASPDVNPEIPPEVHMAPPRAPAPAAAAPPQGPAEMLVGGVRRDAEPDASDFGDFGAERDDPNMAEVFAADRPPQRASRTQPLDIRPEGATRPAKRRRGLFSRLFIFVVLFASLGMGAWWVYTSGLLLTASERDTSVPNPPPHAEAEDFNGEAAQRNLDPQQGFSEDWIEVFEPKQIASIDAHPNATVDVQPASEGTAVRIVSKSADADGNVVIVIPATAMRELAGRTSTIALTLQSLSDKPVQISVECNFDRLGDCARHRFTVNPEKGDVLFKVSFERSIAPTSAGELILNSDLSGKGQGVNLYSVRVLPGQ
ncbi:MAG: hypothetical protein ACOH2J_14635 [Allorhizobium sp.]